MNSVFLALALGLAAPVAAECPNACSGHGTCGAFDECHCFPSWQEADCSGRTCPFALAHVDSPKGDLDGSADALSGRTTTVIEGNTVYPYGTTEQYPLMVDTFGRELINTAHAYAECGNKGLCDRKSGECECFPGYEGAGCQRASCGDPTCSGHGTCMSAKDLAKADHDNRYRLWDKDVAVPGPAFTDCVARGAEPAEGQATVFWSEADHFVDGAERQHAAAALLLRHGAHDANGTVVDVGAGRGGLRRFLPPATAYVAADVTGYGIGAVLCDVNRLEFPFLLAPGEARDGVAAFAFLGSFEYVLDKQTVLRLCRMHRGAHAVFAYNFRRAGRVV
jgi:hypothetical protein